MKRSDLTFERVPHNGHIVVTWMAHDPHVGTYLAHRHFVGYSMSEVKRMSIKEITA